MDFTVPGGGWSSNRGSRPVCCGDGERRVFGSMKRMLAEAELLQEMERYRKSLMVEVIMEFEVQAFHILQRRHNLQEYV
jgi:hypothetical protein